MSFGIVSKKILQLRIYTNLFNPVTAKTITVISNWGTSTDTTSIATAKGWTVTG